MCIRDSIQMHYLNTSDADITVHVTLNGEAYDAGVTATKTFAYVTFSPDISIPLMTTHAHKQAVHTEVRNGAAASTDVVFSSNDWEHPGAKAWMATPFYSFA